MDAFFIFVSTGLILVAASFLQGLTGFGFGIVAMALLPLTIGFRDATLLVALLGLLNNLVSLFHCRSDVDRRAGWQLAVGVAVGCPIGVYLVQSLDEGWLLRALGGLIVVFSLRELFFVGVVGRPWPTWSGYPAGALAGLFGAAFNIGGPPAVAYVYSQDWPARRRLALLQVLFCEIGLLRLALTAASGGLGRQAWAGAAVWALPSCLAVLAGHRALDRLPAGSLKRPVFWFLLAMGVKYVCT